MATDPQTETAGSPAPRGGDGSPSRPERPATIQSWQVNVRLLVWSLVVVGVLAPTLYFWYRYQVHRHAAAILARARVMYENEEWHSAASTFHKFLQMRPDDEQAPEAMVLRALAFDKPPLQSARRPQAVAYFFQALAAKENRDRLDLRLRLAELLFESTRFEEAQTQATKVADALASATSPSESAAADLLEADRLIVAAIRAQVGPARKVRVEHVVEAYENGLVRHPGDIPLSIGLAEVLRRNHAALAHESPESLDSRADECIDAMVAENETVAAAYLERYKIRIVFRIPAAEKAIPSITGISQDQAKQRLEAEKEAADQDLLKAFELGPDDPAVLKAAAEAAAEFVRTAEPGPKLDAARAGALRHAQRLIEVIPNRRDGYLLLAALHIRWKEPQAAIEALQAGMKQIKKGETDLELNRALLQMQLFAGDADEAARTLARLEPVVRRAGPYLASHVRRRLGEDVEVARAQLELLKGNATAALPALKRMAASVTEGDRADETHAERIRRWRLLGGAYVRAGLHDLAAAAFDELVRLEPTSHEFRLQAAAQWRASGDIDRAVRDYEEVTSVKSREPEVQRAWFLLAEARLDQQLRKTAVEARDWKGFDAALSKARGYFPDSPGIVVLQAAAAIARNQRQDALDELKKLTDDKDLEPALLTSVAALLQSAGDNDAADAALERFADAGGDPATLAVMRADVLRRRSEIPAAIRVLEVALEKVPEAQRPPLLRRMISLEIESGAILSARHRLSGLRKAKSRELWVYETAADLAMLAGENGDLVDLEDCERELVDLEGPNGSLWRYFQAVRLLASEKDPLDAARKAAPLLAELEVLRPTWPQLLVLRGRIAQRQGNLDLAADSFAQALTAGARGMTTYNWMVATLYKQGKFGEAAPYILRGGQIATLSGDLASQAIPLNLRAGNIKDALRVAKAAAEFRKNETLPWVWYGQTLALAGQPEEAKDVFLKAIALDATKQDNEKNVLARSMLIWFYSRQGRPDDARQALAELVKVVKMSPVESELVLARGSELIGDRQEAEQHFLNAIARKKKDANILEEVGRFYFRFDHEKALDMYQQALEINPKAPEPRRAVALLLGLRGSDADLARAVALLDQGDKTGEKSSATDDRRLQATLFIVRGGAENARKGVAILTELLAAKGQSRPGDRLLLARAFEELQALDEAKAQFAAVLKENETPAFLILYIEFLNRHEQLEEAGRVLARLEEKDPSHARILELRVNWLKATGRAGEIEAVVDAALAKRLKDAKDDNQKVSLLRAAAELLTRVELFETAEKKLHEVAALVPGGYEFLALWLARRERVGEALALCLEKSSGSDIARGTIVLVRVLTLAATQTASSSAAAENAEQTLAAALASLLKKRPPADEQKADRERREKELVALLLEMGVLRVMQGRDADAIALYEQALEKAPANPIVLNNLAVLLAESPDRAAEAVTMIDKAVAAAPNALEFLDSKALVLIGAGRFAEARDILDRLCRTDKKNSRYRLHLAIALFRLNEPGQSREQSEQALKDGLEKEMLTPSERRHLKEITGDLATR